MFKHSSLVVMVVFALSFFLFHSSQLSHANEVLPAISLTVPENEGAREYLGLSGSPGDTFQLSDIKADVLIIELFSMYCPYCQAEAPRVNQLYDLALQMQDKGVRIRVVGLGASNTQFEVDHFKDTYDVQFPLFPDKNLAMYKGLQGEGTPGFIGCLIKKGESPQIVFRQSGGFDSPDVFLGQLVESAGFN